jgi:uncharacterized protein involved in exopolysaccharide biosynthesis
MTVVSDRFPTGGALAAAEPAADAPAAVVDLRGFAAIVRRRRGWIVWPAIVCLVAALGYVLTMPARYTATTQILLDPLGLRVLQNDLTTRPTTGDTSLAEAESQLQVVSSAGVLTAVVEREGLQNDPEFGLAPPGLIATVTALFAGAARPEGHVLKAVRILQTRVTTRRPDKTFVIDVSVWSENRDKAARIANAIASVYLEQEAAAKIDAAKRTNAALVARLAELRERVAQSAHRVEDYKAQHKIIGASGQLVNEQQLSELNNQLGLARARTAEQRARYEDIQRLLKKRVEPDAVAEALQSPAVTALRAQYAEARQAEANARAVLGPRHPTVTAAAAQVAQTRRSIEEEVARVARAAQSEYDRARANEETLAKSLETLKSDAVTTNQAIVRLRELEREAESNRTVYAAFLTRAKEIGEQENVDNTNSRVISRAVPPTTKSGPPRSLIVAGALVLGLLAGLGLALAREQFDTAAPQDRQDAPEPGMRVLAMLPRRHRSATPVFEADSPEAAAMERLYADLRAGGAADGPRVILVTSPDNAQTRSLVALNLAILAGAEGEQALLVDGDRAQQTATSSLGGDGKLLGIVNRIVGTPWDGLRFLRLLHPGPDRDTAFRLRDAILADGGRYDFIVIDGGLLLSDPSVRGFASFVDDVVVVLERDAHADRLDDALGALGADRAKVAGAVLAA